MKLEGAKTANRLVEEIKRKVEKIKENGINPTLVTMRIGEDPSSASYERGLKKRCEEVGMNMKSYTFTVEEKEKALDILSLAGRSNEVGGILLFQPLPAELDAKEFIQRIPPEKDVDCVRMENIAKVFAGDFKGHCPSTPLAVMEMIKDHQIELKGKDVLIINRTMVVGKPLGMMMLKEDATVTLAHSKTKNLKEKAKKADILCTAMGKSEWVDEEWVSENQYIFDIGIAFTKEGKLTGDVKEDGIKDVVKGYSPVPGGVGAVTNVVLLKQVLQFYSL